MAGEEKDKDKKGKQNETQSTLLQPAFNFASSLNCRSLNRKAKQKKRLVFGESLPHKVHWQTEVTLRADKAMEEA